MSKVDRRAHTPDAVAQLEADQGAESKILAAHLRPDGTYVFEDEESEPYPFDEYPREYPTELDHSRSHVLSAELASGLRRIDASGMFGRTSELGIAILEEGLAQAVLDEDPRLLGIVYPIINQVGKTVALVGLDHTFDLIVEPLGTGPEPEISVYFATFRDYTDTRGVVIEAQKDAVGNESRIEDRDKGPLIVEPHVFRKNEIAILGQRFRDQFLCVRLGPKAPVATSAGEPRR